MAVDQNSPGFREVLAQTAFWCSKQSLCAEAPETPDLVRRRRLIQEAVKLMQGASGQRPAYESRDWQRASDLLREADVNSFAPLEYQLRTPALTPSSAVGEVNDEAVIQGVVADVIARRSQFLSSSYEHRAITGPLWPAGRLLIYFPGETVWDGASKYASSGFCDSYDAPPWDSWLHYADGELISWVPAVLVPLAQEAIDANPVACIRWAD